jgi:hypothetical protein
MVEIAEFFRQFGPMGLAVVLMGSGLVYLLKWLRDMQEKSTVQHDLARREFMTALKEQQTEHRGIVREVVTEFKAMHYEHGERIDQLAVRIDQLDRGLRN